MSLSCGLYGEPTTLDNYHIGKRAGKNMPLDIDTDEPYGCSVWRSQKKARHRRQTRYYQYHKGSGQYICSDADHQNELTVRNTWIPLSKNTGEQCQCQ